jgi:hypothetical protein
MSDELTPEQRHLVETFLSESSQVDQTWPLEVRERLAGVRRFAEVLLRASGPQATDEDRRQLAEVVAEQNPEPWTWVRRGAGAPGGHGPDDESTLTPIERHHQRAEEFARRAVAAWVGHPAVVRDVEATRPALVELVSPLALPDQEVVTLVTAWLLGGNGVYADGSEWPDPFEGAPPLVVELAEQIGPSFGQLLSQLADRIARAGAPVDPTDPAIWFVLAQLALLEVDFARPAAEIAADLNIWPPGSIDREAAALGHIATRATRHGRDARFAADLAAAAGAVADRTGLPPIRPPYSGGRKRKTREDTVRLRRALAVLLVKYPDLTPGRLLALVQGEEHPALVQLRKDMGWGVDFMPDKSRLERNWPKSRQ